MDKLKAFLSDKKNTPIVGAVAGIVLVLVVLFYLKQFGIIGGQAPEEFPTQPPSQTDTGTTPTGPDGVSPVAPVGPDAGQQAGPAQPSAPAGAVEKIPPLLAYRKDPFMGFAGPPTKSDALKVILPSVRRIRLAPASVLPPPGQIEAAEVLPPQPMRRVAGIMWGTTVKAIMESGGKTYIVQPGQVISSERVRVESIDPSGVVLSTLDTKRPMNIRVNLSRSLTRDEDAGQPGVESPPPSTSSGRGRGPRGPQPQPGGMPTEAPPPGL